MELTEFLYRTRQIPSPHNHHTSLEPYPPRLGRRKYVSTTRTKRWLLQHVTRMVHH